MTLNSAYSWTGQVSYHGRRAYAHTPVEPAFLLEEPYDEEGPDDTHADHLIKRSETAMMGQQSSRQKPLFYSYNLDEHVPSDHLLRGIDRCLVGGEFVA